MPVELVPCFDIDYAVSLVMKYRFNDLSKSEIRQAIKTNCVGLFSTLFDGFRFGFIALCRYEKNYSFDAYEDIRRRAKLKANGANLEAGKIFLNYFDSFYKKELWSFPDERNIKGIAALRKLGFKDFGRLYGHNIRMLRQCPF
jgi:hypothetical protein